MDEARSAGSRTVAPGLRAQLLRWMLPPIGALLGLGGLLAYYSSIEPASEAYDLALTDAGLALGERIRSQAGSFTIDLPGAADQVLRKDKYDTIYYRVRAPDGAALAGDPDLPPPPPEETPRDGVVAYDTLYRGQQVRAVAVFVPCEGQVCIVQVAETINKRRRLVRGILLSSLLPEILVAAAMLGIVWFGVRRGVEPLRILSEEIRARTPQQLSPVDISHAPAEAHTLVSAINQLLGQVSEANRNQQRFLANAAHQLRTPLAGLQAHTELALKDADPAARRAALEYVHSATVRTVRLANQLLALARAEPGGMSPALAAEVDMKAVVDDAADEWVHRALARGMDLGFELEECRVPGDAFLLREAFANLVYNALEYTPKGGTVTVRVAHRDGHPVFEVDDEGPGIPPGERDRVLERFYRVSGTPGEGSGLGLAIVQEIATAHRARLSISDGPGGKGARVALVFAAGIE